MSEIKLLPCPFCGGEAEVIGHYIKAGANNFQYFVRCKKCKARPQSFYTFKKKEKAVEVWNTRKPIERIVERLEEKTKKAMHNSEKAAELGEAYEKHMILNGAKGNAFEEAIEIVKEEGGIC